ncbi:hypothetical protein [Microvirga zambiensis]|uniref:hypothetical protein n=1 Tax=Microvirga zambiensis TaxID=1402137 RepID=UPI00191FCCBD|nr:hypothetical protein [Microvirga zambiensis]
MKYVRIVGDLVTNVIELDHEPTWGTEEEAALWRRVHGNTVVENYYTVNEDGTFSPPPGPAPVVQRQFTFLEFMDLFTDQEQLTLVEASMSIPAIKLWYDKALGAQFIDLDDPRTEPGLQALVNAGLISSERKAAVMAGRGPE